MSTESAPQGSLTTDSPLAAREHARAQGGVTIETMPVFPAATAEHWPADVPEQDRSWAETVAGGNYTALSLARGTVLELTDIDGDACASVLIYNRDLRDERLNVADTVKIQWQAYLGEGAMLLSDRGRVLASIVGDSSGKLDALVGTANRAYNERKYGDGAAQGPSPAGRELLILAAEKFGLAPRDVPPSVNLFQGVTVSEDGSLTFTGSAGPGAVVRLRMELPSIVLIANTVHPADPRPGYTSTPLRVRAWRGRPATADSPEATASPEAERAFANTLGYAHAAGLE